MGVWFSGQGIRTLDDELEDALSAKLEAHSALAILNDEASSDVVAVVESRAVPPPDQADISQAPLPDHTTQVGDTAELTGFDPAAPPYGHVIYEEASDVPQDLVAPIQSLQLDPDDDARLVYPNQVFESGGFADIAEAPTRLSGDLNWEALPPYQGVSFQREGGEPMQMGVIFEDTPPYSASYHSARVPDLERP